MEGEKTEILASHDDMLSAGDIQENKLRLKYLELLESTDLQGKYQKMHFIVTFFIAFSCCMTILMFPLQKVLPKYNCYNKLEFDDGKEYSDFKTNTKRYDIINNEQCIEDYCTTDHLENHGYGTIGYLVLVIDKASMYNWITQLGVMCNFHGFFHTASFIAFVGNIIIPSCMAYIVSKTGRLMTFRLCLKIMLVVYIFFYFSTSTYLTTLCCFLAYGFYYAYTLHSYMGTEFMSKSLGQFFIAFNNSAMPLSGIIYILLMYNFANWNVILVTNIIIFMVLITMSHTVIKESPDYLLSIKKYDEFEEVAKYMASFNGMEVEFEKVFQEVKKLRSEILITNIKNKDDDLGGFENESKLWFFVNVLKQYLALFDTKGNVIKTFKFTLVYISMYILFYGYLLNVEKMEGSVYVNLALIFIGEFISENFAGALMQMFSTKQILLSMFSLCLGLCIILIFFSYIAIIRVSLLFANAFAFSMAFVVVWSYTNDCYESNVKASAYSFLMNCSNLCVSSMQPVIELFPNPFYFFAIFSAIPIVVCFYL